MQQKNDRFQIETDLVKGNNSYLAKVDRSLLKTLLISGQNPKAIIISCSDSRVPVEVIFNALEPGALFVIRVAGNVVAGPIVIGSIELAIRQLKTSSIILLGHTGCGAVQTRLNGHFESRIVANLCSQIKCKSRQLNEAILQNLEHQFKNMLEIECVREGTRNGSLQAYAMIYDLGNGKVKIHQKTSGIRR